MRVFVPPSVLSVAVLIGLSVALQWPAGGRLALAGSTPTVGSEPTVADLAYGSDPRQVMDLWSAPGSGPHPLVIDVHGGAWVRGDKSLRPTPDVYVNQGISYAAINYRLLPDTAFPGPMLDVARAVQLVRHASSTLGVDPDRIALTGKSAGGCAALWVALHDDLADPGSDDPVSRQSSRVRAVAVSNAQTTIDLRLAVEWVGPRVLNHGMLWSAVGARSGADAMGRHADYAALYDEYSPRAHISSDDPPVYLSYSHDDEFPSRNANHAIHHPNFGLKFQEEARAIGVETVFRFEPLGEPAPVPTGAEFVAQRLLSAVP